MCFKSVTFRLALTVFMTCFGSAFLIGYNLGIINLPAPYIKSFLADSYLGNQSSLNESYSWVTPSFLYAQVATSFVVAGAIGAFLSGFIADRCGRRNGLVINNLFAITGGVMSGLCLFVGRPSLLYVGRALSGLNSGITIGIGSMYLMEIAPQQHRGFIGATVQLAITLGIALSYVATLTSTLNTPTMWPYAIGLSALPAALSLFTLPFCPKSPRYLALKKRDEAGARAAWALLNPKGASADDYIIGLAHELTECEQGASEFKFCDLFRQKSLRLPVLIAVLIQVLQQLSGINAVITYSSSMLETAGIASQFIEYCVLGIGLINVVMTIIAMPLLDRCGRRTLLIWPTLLLALSLLILTITVSLVSQFATIDNIKADNGQALRILGITSVAFIIIYVISFAVGLGPIPALIVSEIFRQGPRASAYSLSQSIQWLCNLAVLCSYPIINDMIGGYSFLPFLGVVIVCWIFFAAYMPETKNRSFDDIASELATFKTVCERRRRGLTDKRSDCVRDEQVEMC